MLGQYLSLPQYIMVILDPQAVRRARQAQARGDPDSGREPAGGAGRRARVAAQGADGRHQQAPVGQQEARQRAHHPAAQEAPDHILGSSSKEPFVLA